MIREFDIDKVLTIIKENVPASEQKEFFEYGQTGQSLFDCVNDQTQYPHVTDELGYACALVENMRGILEHDHREQEELIGHD